MKNKMNHIAFWEKYIALSSEEESKQFLKSYLFSLPPAEMKKWLLSETHTIVSDLKAQLNDPTVNDTWKADLTKQITSSVLTIEQLASWKRQNKAA